MKKLVASVMFVAVALPTGAALAQAGGGDTTVYKKRTVIDFSDVTIEGELTKPEGAYMSSRKSSAFNSLIKPRDNFVPEMLLSVDNL
jgi:hypothetical protein